MNSFLKHEPCPSCGSRDNLARYSDGSAYCFGCGRWEAPNAESIGRVLRDFEVKAKGIGKPLPDDFSQEIQEDGVKWLQKYNISVEEALFRGVGWSKYRNQLIFTWRDPDGHILTWQGRNFNPESKSKYFTGDGVNDVCPVYPVSGGFGSLAVRGSNYRPARQRTLILTEDATSAFKIARWCDSMPCLGSALNPNKLSALRPFYDVLGVWLDSDKWGNAIKIADQAKLLGFTSTAIYTEYDPKEYDDEMLVSQINLVESGLGRPMESTKST